MTPPRESLLLLPGMMCDERVFAHQCATLETRVAGAARAEVHLPTGADSIDALADEALRNAPERFTLVGHSLGGIIAMTVAQRAPGRVKRLALLGTNPFAETPERQSRRLAQLERLRTDGLADVLEHELLPAYFAHAPERLAEHRPLLWDMANRLGADVFARQSRALLHRRDALDGLSALEAPVLLVCGANDLLCPPDYHETMSRVIPHNSLHVIPEAGHFMTLEAPRQTTRILCDWLEENR